MAAWNGRNRSSYESDMTWALASTTPGLVSPVVPSSARWTRLGGPPQMPNLSSRPLVAGFDAGASAGGGAALRGARLRLTGTLRAGVDVVEAGATVASGAETFDTSVAADAVGSGREATSGGGGMAGTVFRSRR